jgi:hypothetical protein
MKTSLKCVLILVTLAVCAAASTESSTPPFALTLEAEENPVKSGSEVKVDITLSNSSNRAMHMSYGLSELDYAFEVRDSHRIPPETEFARESKGRAYFANDHLFYLQPGENLPKALLVVSKFYDVSRPEKYNIQVSRAVPMDLGAGTIKSNVVTITITE